MRIGMDWTFSIETLLGFPPLKSLSDRKDCHVGRQLHVFGLGGLIWS